MKLLIASLVLMSAFAAQATELNTYVCKVNTQWSPNIPADAYSLKVTELEDITDRVSYGSAFDYIMKVKVELKTKINGRISTRTFFATANSADVNYDISAVKAEGFRFSMYFDEMDQSAFVLDNADRTQTRVSLNCKSVR